MYILQLIPIVLPLTLLFFSNLAIAAPSQTNTTNASQVNCRDPTTGLTPACWLSLNLTGYVQNWNSVTTPNITAHIDKKKLKRQSTKMKMVKERAAATGSQVCSEDGQTWSTCFLQQQATAAGGSGGSGTDCSVLNGTGCDMPVAAGTGMEVEMYYVAYSIYVINAYLTLISNALSSILSDSPSFLLSAGNSNTVFNLTSASAQVLPIDLALTNILTYSSSSSLGLSSSLAPTSPSPNTALIALLPFYRSELTYRFATGAGALERLLRERLEQLLVGIMENVQEFLALAGGGAFLVRDDRFGLRGVEGLVEVLEAGFGQ